MVSYDMGMKRNYLATQWHRSPPPPTKATKKKKKKSIAAVPHNKGRLMSLEDFHQPLLENRRKTAALKIGPPAEYFWIPVYTTSDLLCVCLGQETNRALHRGDAHTERLGQEEELGWISDWRYHPIERQREWERERERERERKSVWKLNFNGVSMSLRMEALRMQKRENNDLCTWLSRRKEGGGDVYCMVWIPPSVGSTQNLNFSSLTRERGCRNEALRFVMVKTKARRRRSAGVTQQCTFTTVSLSCRDTGSAEQGGSD